MSNLSGLFAGISTARKNFSGLYFYSGSFITQLKAVKHIEKLYRTQQPAIVFEQRIIAVRGGEGTVRTPSETATPQAAQPGMDVAYMISRGAGKQAEMFLPNLKTAISDILRNLGINTDTWGNVDAEGKPYKTENERIAAVEAAWMQALDNICGPNQMISGSFLGVTATQISQQNGKPFTRITFDAVYSASQLRQILAALGQSEETSFAGGGLQKLIDAEVEAAAKAAAEAAKKVA